MNKIGKLPQIGVLGILLVMFVLLYVIIGQLNMGSWYVSSNGQEGMKDVLPMCPNYLRQEGDRIMLYDLNQPGSSTNPAIFYSLAEYSQFVKEQQLAGRTCPVLTLDTDLVGESLSGAPRIHHFQQDGMHGEADQGTHEGAVAAESGVSNEELQTFDSLMRGDGLVGKWTPNDDVIPDGMSTNPMDHNWGGVQYSAQVLASGANDGDQVAKPLYYNMRQGATFMSPGFPGMEKVPHNFVPRDLIGKDIHQ
jgi:hypothetical protein